MQVDMSILASQPFLQGLSRQQLERLQAEAMFVEFQADDVLLREGAPANRFYLLLSGQVILESKSGEYNDESGPVPIETISEGSVIGWSWLFPPYRWHFDVRAITPVKAIFFYGTRLRERCEADHELGYELMKRMAAVAVTRLQATRRRLAKQSKIPPETASFE